jgi:putative endopeptidase
MRRQLLLALALGAAWTAPAVSQSRSGIDLAAIDPSVRPQEDFWQFANGKWLAATPIPPDRPAWDTFSALREATEGRLRDAVESIDPQNPGSPERRKLAELYASFMDEASVEAAGLGALAPELRRIHALRSKSALPALFAHLDSLGVRIPMNLEVAPDERDATRYVAYLRQGGLGLPDRDF